MATMCAQDVRYANSTEQDRYARRPVHALNVARRQLQARRRAAVSYRSKAGGAGRHGPHILRERSSRRMCGKAASAGSKPSSQTTRQNALFKALAAYWWDARMAELPRQQEEPPRARSSSTRYAPAEKTFVRERRCLPTAVKNAPAQKEDRRAAQNACCRQRS